jgi:hypothetical protein
MSVYFLQCFLMADYALTAAYIFATEGAPEAILFLAVVGAI